ncbi:hypothetical protein ACJEQ8_37980, partial [Klebsiella pneumoniae]
GIKKSTFTAVCGIRLQRLNGFGFDRRKRHLAGRGGFGCCQRQRLGVTILNQSCIKKQQAAMW